MLHLHEKALAELATCLGHIGQAGFQEAVAEIAEARRIALYGVGREGLQIKGLAMRLFHLGLQSAVVGDMTTPPLSAGDLLIVSAGPGDFSTVSALIGVARQAGARVLVVTAQPDGAAARKADRVLCIPAQTMADDWQGAGSVLPMGSLYEGALYLTFELMILALRERLDIAPERMRANHTNLE
ncbi:SIS domain-containing protein [Rhizobium sp. SSA_523]|uniref:SIS domain-containing protein n=1 Tax=Rhizobium sp. SSA_523 TaxID=2952477 RepID=UPI002090B624|nr:SIS domain-containing protein [Rhizobium sp. SSA_523]MCO5734246.1 SIS domain-containing protein [Rhizobium sp. SSA_523]WKC21480.1 SIS domain-containing protein [Rhizobium sp. SSA_523]